MRSKSPITWLLQRLALFGAFFAVCFAENATAQSRPFLNVSSRAHVQTGDKVVIAGFVITTTATTTKQVLIRGIGPSLGGRSSSRPDLTLTPSALIGPLANPTLTLNGPNGPIYSNDNWRDNQEIAIQATGLAPTNNLESAIIWDLPPGSYTVTLAGNNGGTGLGVVEIYDLSGPAPIVNLSTRAEVGSGNIALIGGVIVGTSTRAVVRAIGPSLTQYGVPGALQNPTLDLYNASGTLLATNDNWGTNNPDVVSEINYLGLGPGNPNESAILATLPAGSYTAIVRGVNGTTGIGMVELFALADATYPRIFQAWATADPLPEPTLTTVARHDLFWNIPRGFGWNWVNAAGVDDENYENKEIDFTDNNPPYPIAELRSLNPNIKILGQIGHWSANLGTGYEHLPVGHPWWKLVNGQMVPLGVEYPNAYLLDNDNPNLRAHVAAQAKALMETGKFDGVLIDTCPAGSYLLPLLTAIRNAIGPNGLIIINANCERLDPSELNLVNGVFMECGKIEYGPYRDWQYAKGSLDWNEFYTREPKVNCLENWFITSKTDPTDMKRMRATTALSLTHSKNGYALFGDSGHFHMWYDFWSGHSLGVPLGGKVTIYPPPTYLAICDKREFKNGTVVWNAAQNTLAQINFPQMRRSMKTGEINTTFDLWGIDGDIYLYYP